MSAFFSDKDVPASYDVVFILSYYKIVNARFLARHKHNLVVHESNLPQGKGWAPLFWQILEGKNKIPVVMFEATKDIDAGVIYLKDYIYLKGDELHDEIRLSQAKTTIHLCLKFIEEYKVGKARKQKGRSTFYRKRTPKDSELSVDKSLRKQFNLLRIVNNESFPAFFYHKGNKYIVHIYKGKR